MEIKLGKVDRAEVVYDEMVFHRIVTRMHSNISAYCTFISSDILLYIFSKYMHWIHFTSKWFEL
jgi:hypothetical protein